MQIEDETELDEADKASVLEVIFFQILPSILIYAAIFYLGYIVRDNMASRPVQTSGHYLSLCKTSEPRLSKINGSTKDIESIVVFCSDPLDVVMTFEGKYKSADMPEDSRPTVYFRRNR